MKEQVLLKKVAKRIRALREGRGMTQQELAALLDYEKSNLSRLESGTVNIKLSTIYKIAQAFEISMSELLDVE
ncbi:MAG: helix-turn-helix transcriptional regulator [Flavipsychrobacter sp.]